MMDGFGEETDNSKHDRADSSCGYRLCAINVGWGVERERRAGHGRKLEQCRMSERVDKAFV